MRKRVSPELIQRQAEELHRFTVAAGRAAELAGEVDSINTVAFDAALDLEFDEEPSGFMRLLRSAKPAEADND